MKSFSIKNLFFSAMAATTLTMAVAGFCIYQVGQASDAVTHAHSARYASYMLADEMRQSSDDLTRLARTYVVSSDPKWEKQYLEVLDIRNGKKPRPAQYEKIYWDFRAAGIDPGGAAQRAVPLNDLMREAGFTEAEFGKLREAENNSNDLVRTETVAMNLVKGLHTDAGGQTRQGEPDLVRARELMHNAEYHAFKARIMKPVNEFLVMLDERTAAAISAAEAVKQRWFMALTASGVVLLLLIICVLSYVYRQIAASLSRAVASSAAMAEGQLGTAIQVRGVAEVAVLLQALESMRDSLVGVVSTVRHNADGVANASSEIAQGNNDLSSRTEQQAAALEETAASMDQLSATVRQNADRAVQAAALSKSASTVAGEGGEVVNHMIETMRGINDSSRKIADIIGVIDGIAFQTNILALNAAVEAARAGEQGRGFAVVAGEVRALAQRSAEAAKEIKTLISGSVSQVEQGSALVDRAGATMGDVVQSIQRVAEIVGEISVACHEQAEGLGQVNEAVNQMDQATQQNAALVEQSAAAADGLKSQARKLVDTVAVFQLGAAGEAVAVAQRPAAPASAPASAPARAPVAARPAVRATTKPMQGATPKRITAPPRAAAVAAGADQDWESF